MQRRIAETKDRLEEHRLTLVLDEPRADGEDRRVARNAEFAALDRLNLPRIEAPRVDRERADLDVRRTGAFEGSGFVSRIERVGATLIVQFQPGPDAAKVSASLTPTGDGRWTGVLETGERRTPVELRRD